MKQEKEKNEDGGENEVRNVRIWIRVNKLEKEKMMSKAKKAGMTMAKFIRESALKGKVKSSADSDAVHELVKINGDLGRLGGLFKLAINDNAAIRMFKKEDCESLLKDIKSHMQTMREMMRKINTA